VLAEVANVVLAREIPQQLPQHGGPVDFLGRQQGISLRQVDLIVSAKIGKRVDARAALLELAVIENQPCQIQILFHVDRMNRETILLVGTPETQHLLSREKL
jgi:hypothetical protein